MKDSISSLFRKRYSLTGILVVILIVLGAFLWNKQNNPIIGTWIGLHSTNTKTREVYTANGKHKLYIDGKLMETDTYKLSKAPNHCGVDMSKRLQLYPKESILILTDTKTGKKHCSLVYKLTKNLMVLRGFDDYTAGVDSLKKVS